MTDPRQTALQAALDLHKMNVGRNLSASMGAEGLSLNATELVADATVLLAFLLPAPPAPASNPPPLSAELRSSEGSGKSPIGLVRNLDPSESSPVGCVATPTVPEGPGGVMSSGSKAALQGQNWAKPNSWRF